MAASRSATEGSVWSRSVTGTPIWTLARSASRSASSATAVHRPIFARCYGLVSRFMEHDVGEYREELLAGISGRVIEVGAGNGMNFRHYPMTTDEVVAVEPEAYLRGQAERAAREAPVPVSVRAGVAEDLPVGDDEFDAAVASLVLCSVVQQAPALAELRRALTPGGELRFFEHVRAEGRRRAAVQAAVDHSGVWPCVAGGCHCSRQTVEAIEAAGFEIDRVRRFELGPSWALTNPVALGVARARA